MDSGSPSRAHSVQIHIGLTLLFVLCTVNSLFAGAKQAKTKQVEPMQLILPGDLKITWYQWETPDQIFLQYYQAGFPRSHTGRFNLETGKFTSLSIPDRDTSSMAYLGALAYQSSPDHKWLTGYPGPDQRHVMEINGSQSMERTIFGLGMRWAPDSQGWIEWKNSYEAIIARRSSLSNEPENDKSQEVIYTLPKAARIIGFTAQNSVLFVAPEPRGPNKDYPNLDWLARTLSFESTPPIKTPWRLRIPHLMGIEEGTISADLKEVCWLAICYQPTLENQISKGLDQAKVSASIWISDPNGNDLRQIATIPLPKESVVTYRTPLYPGPDLPHNIQWVPGNHKVSYHWHLQIWTVELPESLSHSANRSPGKSK